VSEGTIGTTVTVPLNERFWLEVIRMASNDTDPLPTLERTQQLRLLFSQPGPSASWHEVQHGR
jgi:hypothetical protein